MNPSENGYGYNNVSNQPPQITEEKPLHFSAMVFESYDKSLGEQNDEDDQEDFLFPFNEEKEHGHSRIHFYCSNNINTQSLKSREESLIDDAYLWLHPTPLDM